MQGTIYKNYALIFLMVIFAANQLDRLALGIVLQDIKLEFSLSDTELGLLSGMAFAFFYSVMGIPIARWADRGNRVLIISLTAAIWSVAVALCGMATSFVQLLLIRTAVAVGEAGCIPPAHSLIADYFPRADRPKAAARYQMGAALSLAVGYFAAGWLNETHGWRVTFIVLGLPGLLLAGLAWLTLIEPRRIAGSPGAVPVLSSITPSYRQVLVTLWANRSFRHLLSCFSIWFFFGYGFLQWLPSFFVRSHGLQAGELGTWLAVVYGVGGLVSTYAGGELATRYAGGNERLQLLASALGFVFFSGLNICAFLASDYRVALAFFGLAIFGANMAQGPIFATIQTLVPSNMRAVAIALVYLFANLIGMGLGPFAAGALSDALQPWQGQESLRYALMILCPGFCWAAWHLWRASRTVVRDLKDACDEATVRPMTPSKLAVAD